MRSRVPPRRARRASPRRCRRRCPRCAPRAPRRSALRRCCSRRCATSCSTSGRISASSALASLGREAAWHATPMIRTSWSPVNESSSDPRRGSCRRGAPARAPRSRSSSGRALAIWLAALIALADARADAEPEGGALGRPVADARPRLGHRRLGALGRRALPAHRRARLLVAPRRRSTRSIPGSSPARARRSAGTSCSPGSSSRSLACLASFVLLERRRRGAARRRRRTPRGALPRALPDGALPAGRLLRVAVPLAVARGVRARRAPALRLGGRRRRARGAHAADRPRARAAARAARAARVVAARGSAAVPLRLPARALARGRRSVGVRARGGTVEPAPLAGRPARRNLERRPRGVGGSRAARVGLERARLLDGDRARGLDAVARSGDQPRAVRVPRALRRAGRDRVAASSARRTGCSRR